MAGHYGLATASGSDNRSSTGTVADWRGTGPTRTSAAKTTHRCASIPLFVWTSALLGFPGALAKESSNSFFRKGRVGVRADRLDRRAPHADVRPSGQQRGQAWIPEMRTTGSFGSARSGRRRRRRWRRSRQVEPGAPMRIRWLHKMAIVTGELRSEAWMVDPGRLTRPHVDVVDAWSERPSATPRVRKFRLCGSFSRDRMQYRLRRYTAGSGTASRRSACRTA
jgi:hypothetical protein